MSTDTLERDLAQYLMNTGYTRAAKWAKRQIRDHQRAMRQIGGLV